MGKSFAATTWAGALLYAATLVALLSKRPGGDFPLPPLWFYFAWAVLPTVAGVLPLLIEAKSAWLRFPRFLVAVLFYGIAWVGQYRLARLVLPPTPDSELAAGFNNFWMLSDRPLNYSLIAAFLCLGLVAPGNKWAIWLRAIWSGETDAMIANSDETGSRRLLRITVAGIVGALAAALFVEVIRADMDAAIWPTVVTSDSFVLPACQLITIVAAWRLARRKSGVMLALAMVSAYLLCVAVIQGDLQYLIIGVPAMFGLVCVAAFVRRGHLKPSSFNDDRGRGYRHP